MTIRILRPCSELRRRAALAEPPPFAAGRLTLAEIQRKLHIGTAQAMRVQAALYPATPDTMPVVKVGDIIVLEEGCAPEFITQQHAVDYWTGADAEGFPDVVERRKARIVAIYRTPLWQRKED